MPSTIDPAIRAINAGDKNTGFKILTVIVEKEPGNENAWLWLSACVDEVEKKLYCLKKAQAINPSNTVTNAAIRKLSQQPSLEQITDPADKPEPKKRNDTWVVALPSQPIQKYASTSDFITLICPNCGGKLQISNIQDIFTCNFCGNEHLIRRNNGNVSLEPVVQVIKKVKTVVVKTPSELAIIRLKDELGELNSEIQAIRNSENPKGKFLIIFMMSLGIIVLCMAAPFIPIMMDEDVIIWILIFGLLLFVGSIFLLVNFNREKSIFEDRKIQAEKTLIDLRNKKEKELKFHQDVVNKNPFHS